MESEEEPAAGQQPGAEDDTAMLEHSNNRKRARSNSGALHSAEAKMLQHGEQAEQGGQAWVGGMCTAGVWLLHMCGVGSHAAVCALWQSATLNRLAHLVQAQGWFPGSCQDGPGPSLALLSLHACLASCV